MTFRGKHVAARVQVDGVVCIKQLEEGTEALGTQMYKLMQDIIPDAICIIL